MKLKKKRQSFTYFREKTKFFDVSTAYVGAVLGYNHPYFNHRIKNYLSLYPYSPGEVYSPPHHHPIYHFLTAEFQKSHPFAYPLSMGELLLGFEAMAGAIDKKNGQVAPTKFKSAFGGGGGVGVFSDTYRFIASFIPESEASELNDEKKRLGGLSKADICFLNHGPLQLADKNTLKKIPYLVFNLNNIISYPLGFILLSTQKLNIDASFFLITEKLVRDIAKYVNSKPVLSHRKKVVNLLQRTVEILSKQYGVEVLCQKELFVIVKARSPGGGVGTSRIYYKNTTFQIHENLALIGIPLTEPLNHLPSKLKETFEYLGR